MKMKLDNKVRASLVVIVGFAIYSILVLGLIGIDEKQSIIAFCFTTLSYGTFIFTIWIICEKRMQRQNCF